MKIKISTILAVLTYILVFFSTTYFDYNPLKYVLIVVVGLIHVIYMSIERWRRHRVINVAVILFCMVTIVVSYINRDSLQERNPFLAAVVFGAILFEMLLTVECFSDNGMMMDLVKIFYRMTVIVLIFTDILAICTELHVTYEDNYLIGDKFPVIYMHFFLMAFFLTYKNVAPNRIRQSSCVNRAVLVLYILLTTFMSVKLESSAGIVGTIAFVVFLWIAEADINILYNAKIFIIALLLSAVFMVGVEVLLQNQTIVYIVTQLLGEDITLTSRTLIYATTPSIMKSHWLIGYGYGSSYEVFMKYGIVNAQNGVMEWLEQVGFIGTIPLIIWMSIAMKKQKNALQNGEVKKRTTQYASLVALVYVFIFLATVEITLSIQTFGLLLIIYGFKKESKKARDIVAICKGKGGREI